MLLIHVIVKFSDIYLSVLGQLSEQPRNIILKCQIMAPIHEANDQQSCNY